MASARNERLARRLYVWLRGTRGMTASGRTLATRVGLTYGSSNFKVVTRLMKEMARADGFCWVYPESDNGYTYGLTVNPDPVIGNLVHLDQTERGIRRVKKDAARCVMSKHPTGDARLVARAMLGQIAAIEAYDRRAPVKVEDMAEALERLRARYGRT